MATAGKHDNHQQNHSWYPSRPLHHEPKRDDDDVLRSDEHENQHGRNHQQRNTAPYQKKNPVCNMTNKLQYPTIDTTPHQPPYLWTKSGGNQKPSRRNHLPPANNWVGSPGGGGMRAIFLDSGQKSSTGTGVFLPKRTKNSSSAAGCSPVLLPARVVQALNLNVNELGRLQLTRRQSDAKNVSNTEHYINSTTPPSTRSSIDVIELHNENAPPELVFLPKEWTY